MCRGCVKILQRRPQLLPDLFSTACRSANPLDKYANAWVCSSEQAAGVLVTPEIVQPQVQFSNITAALNAASCSKSIRHRQGSLRQMKQESSGIHSAAVCITQQGLGCVLTAGEVTPATVHQTEQSILLGLQYKRSCIQHKPLELRAT